MEEQGWRVEADLAMARQGSSARQSHDGPGCGACERELVPLLWARPSLPPSLRLPQLLLSSPWSPLCSMYLKSVVRVDAAPSALLQLHLRVEIFLVLLHYVRQIRTPAALCVVLLAVAVVVMMVLRESEVGKKHIG